MTSAMKSLMVAKLMAITVLIGMHACASAKAADRDKTGTTAPWQNEASSQTVVDQQLASLAFTKAEGKGLEPSTPCGATDFESVSSPFGYPPGETIPIYIVRLAVRKDTVAGFEVHAGFRRFARFTVSLLGPNAGQM